MAGEYLSLHEREVREVRAKAIEDFAERMKELSECGEISVFGWNRIVDEIAEEYAKDTNIQTIDVSELLGESERVKHTNADLIRAMSDEELAEWLAVIDHYWNDGECVVNFGDAHVHDSRDDILEWLQSEAEE